MVEYIREDVDTVYGARGLPIRTFTHRILFRSKR